MKKILLIALLIVGLLIPNVSGAQAAYPRDITLSWTWPTTYTDASLIQDGDLRGGDLYCFRNQDTIPIIDTVPVVMVGLPGASQIFTFVGVVPQPGQYHCFLTAVAKATTDQPELSSDFSNEAFKRYTGKPLPPQDFIPGA